MSNPSPSGFMSIGHIDRAHGLQGEVKVIWELTDPSVIHNQENLVVFLKNNRVIYTKHYGVLLPFPDLLSLIEPKATYSSMAV